MNADEDSEEDDFDDEVEEEVPRGVLQSRLPEDVYREALVRGREVRANGFGDEAGQAIGEEEASGMLEEEDLVIEGRHEQGDEDMDMDADLDADVPEADMGGYEHTDTEDELTSSEDESVDVRFPPARNPAASSMVRSDGTQNSMDLGSMLSESSHLGSSPRPPRGFEGRRSGL